MCSPRDNILKTQHGLYGIWGPDGFSHWRHMAHGINTTGIPFRTIHSTNCSTLHRLEARENAPFTDS